MKEIKWTLCALFKVLLFEVIVGTIANAMGIEYRPSRYLGGYPQQNYYPRPRVTYYRPYSSSKISYRSFYDNKDRVRSMKNAGYNYKDIAEALDLDEFEVRKHAEG